MTAKTVTVERSFDAPLEDVWELWTTKEGIESWWGPPGFRVEVHSIDLRVGGTLRYAMIADSEQMVAFMKKEFGKVQTEHSNVYRAIEPMTLLHYTQVIDFVPGQKDAYEGNLWVKIEPENGRIRVQVVFDEMHDPMWTGRAKMGWELELGKLEKALAAKRGG